MVVNNIIIIVVVVVVVDEVVLMKYSYSDRQPRVIEVFRTNVGWMVNP